MYEKLIRETDFRDEDKWVRVKFERGFHFSLYTLLYVLNFVQCAFMTYSKNQALFKSNVAIS